MFTTHYGLDVRLPTPLEPRTPELGERVRLKLLNYIDEMVTAGLSETDMYIIGGIFKRHQCISINLRAISLELYYNTGGLFDLLSIPGLLSNEHYQGKLQRLQAGIYAPYIVQNVSLLVQILTDESLDQFIHLFEALSVSKQNLMLTIGGMQSDIFLELLLKDAVLLKYASKMNARQVERMEQLAQGFDGTIVGGWLRFVNRIDIIQASFDNGVVRDAMRDGESLLQIWIKIYTRFDEVGVILAHLVDLINEVMNLAYQDPPAVSSEAQYAIRGLEARFSLGGSDEQIRENLYDFFKSAPSYSTASSPQLVTSGPDYYFPGVSPLVDILILRLAHEYTRIGRPQQEMIQCLSDAFTGMMMKSENTAIRIDRIIVPRALKIFEARQTLPKQVLRISILVREYLGLNLFARAPCLLELPELSSPVKQESLTRGHLLAYLVIAESNGAPSDYVSFMVKAKDVEFLAFEKAMRRYVQGIRWFWRQSDILGFEFPVNLKNIDSLTLTKVANRLPDIESFENHKIFQRCIFKGKLGRDILYHIAEFAGQHVLLPVIADITRDAYSVFPSVVRLSSQLDRNMHGVLREIYRYESNGSWLMRRFVVESHDPSTLDELATILGELYNFLRIWERSMDDDDIDRQVGENLLECFLLLKRLHPIPVRNWYFEYARTEGVSDDILSVLRGLAESVRDRVEYRGPKCVQIPQGLN